MNTMNLKKTIFAAGLLLNFWPAQAWWGNNGSLPCDVMEKTGSPCRLGLVDWEYEDRNYVFNAGMSTEVLFGCEGRDKKGVKVGVNQIFSPKDVNGKPVEPYGPFFEGSDTPSADIDFAERLHGISNTDFGDIRVEGRRAETQVVLWGSMTTQFEKVPGNISLNAYMPLKMVNTGSTSVASVNATNVTSLVDLSQTAIKAAMKSTGNLSATGWNSESILGDPYFMLSWHNIYEQDNDILRSVGLIAQAGVSIPAAKIRDQNNIFSVPNGADGAFGFPISLAVDAQLYNNFKLFGCAVIYPFFDDSNNRRLRKTDSQGDLLLPEVTKTTRNSGTLFRLTGMVEFTSNSKLFWGGCGYQYGKKTADKVSTNNSAYSHTVINNAERWQDADFHNLIGYFGLDLSEYIEKFAPRVSCSFRYPLKGKRIALFKGIGLEATLSF